MSTGTAAPNRPDTRPGRGSEAAGRDSFGHTLWAEWTKFRTVRGWMIGMVIAGLLTVLIGYLSAAGSQTGCGPSGGPCQWVIPQGPGGEAVTDSFYFVHRSLAGNGSITARVTSLTGTLPSASGGRVHANIGGNPQATSHPGVEQWSKAGIIIKASTQQGSAYAAVMVTGDHGVRMQYDYTQDIAGAPGRPSAASPRWLRLTRSGDTITGYASADGTRWTRIGTATLPGLPSTVQAGLFATSPAYSLTASQGLVGSSSTGGPTTATGVLDHVTLHGAWPAAGWRGDLIGGGPNQAYPVQGGAYHQAGGVFTVTGSGDIAPDPANGPGPGETIQFSLVGTFFGMIAVVVVGAMFITAEYRRGLIRTTLTASPRRGQVLAAKAVVIGAVAFVAGIVAAVVAIPLSSSVARHNGNYILPVSALTEARLIVGTGALLAVAAILALAVGATIRRSAIAVTTVIVVIVLPYLLSVINLLPAGGDQWLMRLVPAAGFSIQQAIPNYPQVSDTCSPGGGCYPLAPWAGFAVLCAWAAAALALAVVLLRRRDA
jgi:ABC-type transport system involved in multi-copper enzyme maturation permease subunit